MVSHFIHFISSPFFIVAHQDFPQACNQLAKIYFQGTGGKENKTKGALWLIRAAENRHEDAVGMLMSSREIFDVFIPIYIRIFLTLL